MINQVSSGTIGDARIWALLTCFFADDVLFFSHGDKDSIGHIMSSIDRFSKLGGLSPNLLKSSSFFSNCEPNVISWFDGSFGIPRGSLPVKFLGVPLITSKLSINGCMSLIEKITARIHSWASKTLSFAGRALLLKAILFSIQSFWTNHFMLPKAVHKQLQTLFTRVIWF